MTSSRPNMCPVLLTQRVIWVHCQCKIVMASFQVVILKTVCQPVVMKNASVFWHLPPLLATPFLVLYLNLALLHSFQTELSGDEWSPPKQRTGIKVFVGGGCFGCKCVCVYMYALLAGFLLRLGSATSLLECFPCR